MAVSLTTANGQNVSTQGSGANPFSIAPTPTFSDIAAVDRSAPGLFSPRTFGQLGGVNASGTTGAASSITPTTAGSTKGFGFVDPSAQARGTGGRGASGGTGAAGDTTPQLQLQPDQEIGIPAAEPGKAPEKNDGLTEDDKADAAIAKENGRQGNAPDYTIGGNMQGRNATFGASARASRTGNDMPGSSSNGGTSDAETADINARAGI